MARPRGNARKKKTRLTDASFSAVMEVGGPRAEPVDRPPDEASSTSESVISSILELLRTEPDAVVMPAVYNDASRVLTAVPGYPAERFVFGLIVCPECHSENIYYQDRDVLAAGYRFRCRICQHELVASLG